MPDLDQILTRLEKWTLEESDFHSDRQLADEILIADGWEVIEDKSFEGGVCWSYGKCPRVSVADANRPHVINDMNTSIGVVPFGCQWSVHWDGAHARASVWKTASTYTLRGQGTSESVNVALLIAAIQYKLLLKKLSRN